MSKDPTTYEEDVCMTCETTDGQWCGTHTPGLLQEEIPDRSWEDDLRDLMGIITIVNTPMNELIEREDESFYGEGPTYAWAGEEYTPQKEETT